MRLVEKHAGIMARKMASHPITGLVQAKRAINHAMETGLAAALRYDTGAWVGCMHSEAWRAKQEGFRNKERKA